MICLKPPKSSEFAIFLTSLTMFISSSFNNYSIELYAPHLHKMRRHQHRKYTTKIKWYMYSEKEGWISLLFSILLVVLKKYSSFNHAFCKTSSLSC